MNDTEKPESNTKPKEELLENEVHEKEKLPGKEVHEKLAKDDLKKLQDEIIDEIAKAKSSEERVRTYGKVVDTYGLDAIVSLFPVAGDAVSSAVSGLYLLFEARNANLEKQDYIKIVALQAADLKVGVIPVAGDVADYAFQANNWSVPMFEKKTKELEEKARQLGVPEEKILEIRKKAGVLPKIAEEVLMPEKGKVVEMKSPETMPEKDI